jgi:exodeoxyribonuclease VII small subunit
MNTEEISFEEAFQRLQATIQTLEEGGLSLEASIQQFELGMKLANLCGSMLDDAELKVSRLLAGRDAPEEGMPLVSYPSTEIPG